MIRRLVDVVEERFADHFQGETRRGSARGVPAASRAVRCLAPAGRLSRAPSRAIGTFRFGTARRGAVSPLAGEFKGPGLGAIGTG